MCKGCDQKIDLTLDPADTFFDLLQMMHSRLDVIELAREAVCNTSKLPITEKGRAKLGEMQELLASASEAVIEQTLNTLEELEEGIEETEKSDGN